MKDNRRKTRRSRESAIKVIDALPVTTLLDLVLARLRAANARGEPFSNARASMPTTRG